MPGRLTKTARWGGRRHRALADADLAAIARGAGVPALTVRGRADLAPVAVWAADLGGPPLLDAKVDPGIAGDWLAEAFRGG